MIVLDASAAIEWLLQTTVEKHVYVALAEALDAPLVTCNGRIASAPGHDARIELIAEA